MILKSRPPFSNSELLDLVFQAQQGDGDAARMVLESFVDMVHKDARRFGRLNVDDAESVALFAISEAIRTFSFEREVPFRAWMRQHIVGYLRNESAKDAGCNTRAGRKLFFKYAATAAKDRSERGGIENHAAVAKALNVTTDDISQFKIATSPKSNVAEMDIPEAAPNSEKALAREERRLLVQAVIEYTELNDREAAILDRLFLNDDFSEEQTTLESVGQDYGITRERVRQIKTAILAKLKATIDRLGLTAELSGD